jgi:hypothetical protein
MRWGLGARIIEMERQEAVERAMARYRADQARKQRRGAARSTTRAKTGLGRGARTLSREEALAKIGQVSPRAALKILAGYGINRPTPLPERRGH